MLAFRNQIPVKPESSKDVGKNSIAHVIRQKQIKIPNSLTLTVYRHIKSLSLKILLKFFRKIFQTTIHLLTPFHSWQVYESEKKKIRGKGTSFT